MSTAVESASRSGMELTGFRTFEVFRTVALEGATE